MFTCENLMMTAGQELSTVRRAAASLGYPQLKEEQELAILSFVGGNDVTADWIREIPVLRCATESV